MARRKRVPKIKLEHRLPNPSPLFVGRERELDWLTSALERGSLVLVTGPGGIGKTALVKRLIHERFRDSVRRTVFFGLRPGAPTSQLRLDLVRVLVQSTKSEVDLRAIADDPEALTEAAIDVAEEHGLWVVLDDAHHADAAEMGELLTMLASYARDSRWLVTSRMEPKLRALQGRVLALGGLGDAELTSIARELGRDRDEAAVHRAVASAAGSPWFLQQYVSSGESGLELSRERLLENLGAEVDPFLRVLGALRVPIPETVLGLFVVVPDAATLAALERRGLIQRDPAGLRLHDAVAGWLGPTDTSSYDRIAGALVETGEPALVVEAARLHRDAGSLDALATLLDAHALGLFAQAQAPSLWAVIGEIRDARIVKHQLRCAAELGNPTALAAVHEPAGDGAREQLAWAATLYAQGEVAKAQALTTSLTSAPEVGVEATLLRARCLLHDADPERALHELGALGDLEAQAAFRRDALAARATALLGHASTDALVAELRRRAGAMTDVLDALHDVAAALLELGRTESADELLERLAATPRGGHASLLVARAALLTRARIRLQAGALRDALVLLDAVRPYVRSASLLRPVVMELDAMRRIAVGDFAGLDALLETASVEAAGTDRRVELRVAVTRERAALVRAEPIDESELPDAPVPERDLLHALRARRLMRWGADAAAPEALVERRLYEADWAMIHGKHASEAARAAVHEAERAGDRLLELEARLAWVDATVASSTDEHAAAVRALVDLGRMLSSTRARLQADLHERFDDPGVLERVAAFVDVAPAAARRARALLGGDVVLDAVDERVVAAFRRRAPSLVVTTVLGDAPDWRPGWGLDARHQRVWLPDGRSVDLSNKAIPWKLLSALVALRGRPASKEELVLGVWGERTYHPSRHDPRVHMSMRKLRELLEDDASQPTRLVTDEEGYRIAGRVRIIDPANV